MDLPVSFMLEDFLNNAVPLESNEGKELSIAFSKDESLILRAALIKFAEAETMNWLYVEHNIFDISPKSLTEFILNRRLFCYELSLPPHRDDELISYSMEQCIGCMKSRNVYFDTCSHIKCHCNNPYPYCLECLVQQLPDPFIYKDCSFTCKQCGQKQCLMSLQVFKYTEHQKNEDNQTFDIVSRIERILDTKFSRRNVADDVLEDKKTRTYRCSYCHRRGHQNRKSNPCSLSPISPDDPDWQI